ncbi:MAG TPA: HAMP domain-containing sensor histidine kinase [Paenibacillus sp.]|nr:HAMP domain-containing sensor histidine kinase [Paenibacillus sp.]
MTASLLFVGYRLGEILIGIWPFSRLIAGAVNGIGSDAVLIGVGVPIFLFIYNEISKRALFRLQRIFDTVQEITEGNFAPARNRPESPYDEIGKVSYALDQMAAQFDEAIEQIVRGLEEIADGRLEHRIDVTSGPFGGMSERINAMAARLEQSIMEERSAEKTKNDLITGVSHDLRTPLTSIIGFLEVVELDRYRDETELRHYVSIAYEKSLKLKKLIDDLFEYTSINNGLPLSAVEFDLVDFIRQLTDEYEHLFEYAGMTCRMQIAEEPIPVVADGSLLARCFGNILTNAMRYGKDGKRVEIQVGREGGEAFVRVVNFGEPIPVGDLPFIFDRFYRSDRSRSTEGSGLGLAIAKSIVQAHGGSIEAHSDRTQTTFAIQLPLRP